MRIADITGKNTDDLMTLSCGQMIHKEVVKPLEDLQQAASVQGFNIAVASGFRSLERQIMIWNAKYSGIRPVYDHEQKVVDMEQMDSWQKVQAILTYSALPGASRHHWGTDFDFYDRAAVDSKYELQLSPEEYLGYGPFYKATNWLHVHSHQYGFYFPYQGTQTGIAREPWHLSYYPLANRFLELLENEPKILFDLIVDEDIEGKNAILHNFEYILDNFVLNVSRYNR